MAIDAKQKREAEAQLLAAAVKRRREAEAHLADGLGYISIKPSLLPLRADGLIEAQRAERHIQERYEALEGGRD